MQTLGPQREDRRRPGGAGGADRPRKRTTPGRAGRLRAWPARGAPPAAAAARAGSLKSSRPGGASDPAQPRVALVLPVAARPLGGEGHRGQELGELVAELDRSE